MRPKSRLLGFAVAVVSLSIIASTPQQGVASAPVNGNFTLPSVSTVLAHDDMSACPDEGTWGIGNWRMHTALWHSGLESVIRSSAVPDNCVQHIGNSLVSVIAVREGNFDRPGDHWFIEFGYRWSTSCHCWAIFYRTNTINKDGSCCLGPDINRQNHYQADVGPANPNEKHTFTIAQDLVDQWSVNLWIDGSHLTRLPLPAGHGGKYGWAKLAQSEINWQEVTYNATFETEFFNNPGGQPGHPTFTHNYEENLSDDPYHCNKYGDFMYSHYGPAPLWPGSCD